MNNSDFIPDDQFVPDDASQKQTAPDFIPDNDPIAQTSSLVGNTPNFVPDEQFTPDEDKYSTPLQQMGTVAEGAAQGIAGPLATAAELGLSKLGVPNMTAQDIAGREAANPTEHGLSELAGFGAGMFTGTSEAGLATKIAERFSPEAVTILGKIGSKAINGAIQSGVFQGANEITKGLLGQSDPNHPYASAIANVGAASLFGLGTGAVLGTAGQAIGGTAKYLQNKNIGKNMNDLLTGMGLASSSTPEQVESFLKGDNTVWQKRGLKLYGALQNKITEGAIGVGLAEALPWGNDSAPERILKDAAGAFLGSKMGPVVAKNMAPIVYKILGSQIPQGAEQSINYALKALQGANKVSKGIDNLFNYGTSKAVDYANPAQNVDAIKDYIDKGGLDTELPQPNPTPPPQGFAEGGEVNPPLQQPQGGIAAHFPEQNMLLNAAKSKISNYLKAQKPMPMGNRLPFDEEHIDPNKEHQYNRIVELADQPLGILNHIKSGRLTAQHMQAFMGMYPDLHDHLKNKILEKIVDKVHDKEKPPYKMRQALSLFMGTDLDSSLSQPNIAAAQSTFAPKQTPQPQEKSSKSSLSNVAKGSFTPDQARLNRSTTEH